MNTTTQRIPLEQLLEEACGKRALTLGVPAPDGHSRRFALTPEGAAMLVNRGFDVRIEREAGRAIHYPDARYLRAGARMVSRAEAFGCDMVLAAGTLDVADALPAIVDMLNAKFGWQLTGDDVVTLGQRILSTEVDFNRRAGITEAADRLPDFFQDEELPPHNTKFDITHEELKTTFNWIK